MGAYYYLKDYNLSSNRRKIGRWGLWGLLFSGLALILTGSWPLIDYQLRASQKFSRKVLSPTREIYAQALSDELVIDYERPSNWFPTLPGTSGVPIEIDDYILSIPELGIEGAVVKIGGQDLRESLVHYSGTALPGQFGRVVVFGHSTLPQFYRPDNYQTIFSTLPTLKKGDEILVTYDKVTYRYLVKQMFEVVPEDVTVLSQETSQQELNLITCVPPGTYLRRLVVNAQLQ